LQRTENLIYLGIQKTLKQSFEVCGLEFGEERGTLHGLARWGAKGDFLKGGIGEG